MLKFIIKSFCCLIPFQKLRKKIRSNILFFLEQPNVYIKNHDVIVPPQGLGDILYLLLSLENKKHKKYTFILRKKHFQELCKLFPKIVKNIIISTELPYDERFLYQHYDIYKKHKVISFLELFKNATMVDIKRDYAFNFDNKYKNKFIKEGFIPQKTVLILSESTSCPNNVSSEYWIKYADILSEQGYLPVFNSKTKYGNHKSIFLNLSDTINFAECAGNIIGYRSGLCDVLSYFTKAKCIFLYPDKPHISNQDYIKDFEIDPAQKFMKFCSLKKINPNKDIQEYIFDERKFHIFEKELNNE